MGRTKNPHEASNKKNLEAFIASEIVALDKRTMDMLIYVGEAATTEARRHHSYKDQTGNLSSSMGYAIKNTTGKTSVGKFKKLKPESKDGPIKGKELAEAKLKNVKTDPKAYTLVIVAGMHYAKKVSARYNVLQSSQRVAKDLLTRYTQAIRR